MKKYFLIWIIALSLVWTFPVKANFKVGESVFVAFPAANIKDDAFIVGLVTKRLENGDYQIRVLDYMQGHDYSLSCVPIREDAFGQATEVAWEYWTDTTKLYTKGMQYQVSQENVQNLQTGKFNFIERNNILTRYLRWKSNAPIMPMDSFYSMIEKAQKIGLDGMIPAIELAQKERRSYYDSQNGRPFWPYETIPALNKVLEHIIVLLEEDTQLNTLWRTHPKDWDSIKQSSRTYFLIRTIDKIVGDSSNQVTEDGMEKVDPVVLSQFKERLVFLKERKS